MPPSKLKAAELKKLEAERLQGFLQELLKEEENKYCADCEAKQPRWASWNLGVFLCIRCAGLHRNLGVHISKVKSVTLDSWTPEQVQSVRVMGNAKARAVYEFDLPHLFRRPQTDQTLEAFIRAKYDAKRYIMKDWVPPKVDPFDLPALPESMAREKKAAALLHADKRNSTNKTSSFAAFAAANKTTHPDDCQQQQSLGDPSSQCAPVQLIDFSVSPKQQHFGTGLSAEELFSSTGPISHPVGGTNGGGQQQLAKLEEKQSNSLDDLFGPIVSAPLSSAGPPSLSGGIPLTLSSPNLSSPNANFSGASGGFPFGEISSENIQQPRLFEANFGRPQSQLQQLSSSSSAAANTPHQPQLFSMFSSPPSLVLQHSHAPPNHSSTIATGGLLIGSDLADLDFSICSVSVGEQALKNSQSASAGLNSALFSSPPATDIKKSTNEILALFRK